ncbi:MAG: glycosyltransferase [Leptolyngbyaceae cyanobacterium MAG.088]|nr:glycosyltransferase [Leptolyngbyaceae cyanobacterium MAG.088]
MALISVIVPVYNSEKTIVETLQSVINQTYTDFEIIVINDGSQDSTLDVLSTITDSRLQVFSYDNAGVSVSRNRGVENASGEFIAFLDADDLWTPTKLESQLALLQSHTQAAVAYSWCDYIDDEGNFLRKGGHANDAGNVYKRLLVGNFLECGSTSLVNRQVFESVGGFNSSLLTNEDWELWVRLARDYEFVVVPEVQVFYRISGNSKSFNLTRHENTRLQVIDQVFDRVPAELQYLKQSCIANFYRYLVFKVVDAPQNNFNGDRSKSFLVSRFLWNSLLHDKTLLQRPKLLFSVSLKIMLLALFPSRSPRLLLEHYKLKLRGLRQSVL